MQRLIGTVVVVMLLQLIVSAVMLWLICKLFRRGADPVRYRRALLATLLIALLNLLVGVPIFYLNPLLPMWVPLVLGFLVIPVVTILVLRLCLRQSFARAFLIFLCWFVYGIAQSIAVVVLLKTFLMEAFIIPTGNMAEMLRGDHKEIECPTCGIRFTVNASSEVNLPGQPGRVVNGCTCPNCRRSIRLVDPEFAGRQPRSGILADDRSEYVETIDPGVKGGDRMIVGKGWLAGSGFPQRMDPFAFKYPDDPQMIYVKRLVGLPGETIAIHGGDLYRLAPEDSPKYQDRAAPEELRKQEFMHQNDEQAVELFRKGKFQIIRKTPAQVLSTMQLVYDNDHPPQDLTGEKWQRWQNLSSHWLPSPDGNQFFHGIPDVGPAIKGVLQYQHRLRTNGEKNALITDFIGYNTGESLRWDQMSQRWLVFFDGDSRTGVNWVGDLVLECEVGITRLKGTFQLELIRADEGFQVVWDLAAGTCELRRDKLDGKGPQNLAQVASNLKEGTHRIRFANVDQRLIVWVDDKLLFGDGVEYTPHGNTRFSSREFTPARMGATESLPAVSKIKLYRDAYMSVEPAQPDVNLEDRGDAGKHPNLEKLPVRTMYVQPGHYFCLGDNSMASADSRSWGVVPERLLLGKALMRYYPWPRIGLLH